MSLSPDAAPPPMMFEYRLGLYILENVASPGAESDRRWRSTDRRQPPNDLHEQTSGSCKPAAVFENRSAITCTCSRAKTAQPFLLRSHVFPIKRSHLGYSLRENSEET